MGQGKLKQLSGGRLPSSMRRVARRAPNILESSEFPGGRRMARRTPNNWKGADLLERGATGQEGAFCKVGVVPGRQECRRAESGCCLVVSF